MTDARNERPIRQYVVWAVQAAAALFGAVWGWGFGVKVGGVLMGLVAALNCAAFSALLLGAAVQWLLRPRGAAGANKG